MKNWRRLEVEQTGPICIAHLLGHYISHSIYAHVMICMKSVSPCELLHYSIAINYFESSLFDNILHFRYDNCRYDPPENEELEMMKFGELRLLRIG